VRSTRRRPLPCQAGVSLGKWRGLRPRLPEFDRERLVTSDSATPYDHAPGVRSFRRVPASSARPRSRAPRLRTKARRTRVVLEAARAAHPLGPRLLVAVARGEPPYPAVPDAKPARVAHALRRLRDHDLAYQPEPRTWRLADPALATALRQSATASRARRHAPAV
jgi:hypothetical protein